MKIGILTWQKGINHGAVLQAYSSQRILQQKFNVEAVMLDYERSKDSMDNSIKNRIRKIVKRFNVDAFKTRKMLSSWNYEKTDKFNSFRKENLMLGEKYDKEIGLDGVLIGSDMVFDFYEGYNPFMYGKDVNTNYIFSYAACFGYTTTKLLDSYCNKNEIIKLLNKMDAVAYRDDNTGFLLKNECGITDAVKTIDPVLLYGFDEERKKWDSYGWKKRKYILIYSYTYNMDDKTEIESIKNFASINELEIISVGYIHRWCDECVNASPKEFVEMFEHASYVITDTFHGTIFSLAFNKQFCSIIRNNGFKVLDVLKDLDLDSRVNGGVEEQIEFLKTSPIDYCVVNKKIEELREKAFVYLQTQVGNISKNCK